MNTQEKSRDGVVVSKTQLDLTRPLAINFASLAATSRSVAVGASDAHERNSPPALHALYNQAYTATTLAGVGGCGVRDEIMQRLKELKSMTKGIAASHHGAGSCDACWKFDLQLDGLSYSKFKC